MTSRPLCALLAALPFLFLVAPTQAQEADTARTDTADVAPVPTDTTQAAATDTAATEGGLPADSVAVADSVAPAAGSVAADTALSAKARRARAKERAQAAAQSWLELTDGGAFGKSWDAASPFLQKKISREAWMKRGARARSTLKSVKSRELTRVQYRDSTDQLPTGGPVVALRYRSEFKSGLVLEAVITTRQDSTWKVAGYRAIPAPVSAQAADSTQMSDSTQVSDSTATEADSTSQQ